MNKTLQKKKQEGFTIIEVLIVLAIAGLIILIVFLAVPALQRNSRNTQRKQDVSALGGALNEYINNNNGQLPNDDTAFESNVKTNSKMSYYDATNNNTIRYTKNTAASAPNPVSATDLDSVVIQTFSKCNGNDATATGATSRSVVAVYNIETGGGTPQEQCQEL
jgi:prepilin-type N-terminal cleavage/methylation domain-containing protein